MADLMERTDQPADSTPDAAPPRSKHVQIGQPQTFNPDAMLEAGIGRSAATGAIVGFVLFTVAVGILGKWIGLNDSGSLFLGMFTGLWGGLGFGVMVGSVLAYNRDERERELASEGTHAVSSHPKSLHPESSKQESSEQESSKSASS